MTALEVPDLVVAASETLGLGTDATLDLLDLTIAEEALAEAKAGSGGDDAAAAAALLHALVLRRPFRQGNDRVALLATLQLLAMHGWRADLDPPSATVSIIAGITVGRLDAPAVRDWLLPRLYCESDSRQGGTSMRSWLPARRHRARRPRASRATAFERFTDRARQVVVLAHEEARTLDHGYIGTEHILLGLIREGSGVAALVLTGLGASLDRVREQVLRLAAERGGGGNQQSA